MKNNIDEQNKIDTKSIDYAKQLRKKQGAWWKILLDVQAPYRWNLRRLDPGYILDIGCGIGRNLVHLNGQGVGIDHNEESVRIARDLGLIAFTPEEFNNTNYVNRQFDSLLLAHVAEHMTKSEALHLLRKYIHLVKLGGQLIMITPQEAGYKTDATHVEFMDFQKLNDISKQLGFATHREFSFPFPRFVGYVFIYNEFILVSRKVVT